MNSQEAILLMMAQKLKSCDEQEMRQLCFQPSGSGRESSDAIYQTLDRWAKLDKATQHKILTLLRKESPNKEVHQLKAHIDKLIETKEKGQ